MTFNYCRVLATGATFVAIAVNSVASATIPVNAPYNLDPQHSYVEDVTSEGIGTVNMITCIMSALRPDALVNKGDYIALVDKVKCDPNSKSSTSNATSSDNAAQAAQYMTTTVNSSRLSNSDPMIARIWVDEVSHDQQSLIYVHLSANEAPSDANPYGAFRMDFCGKGPDATCMSQGFLEGSASGLSFYQEESGGGGANTTALTLSKSGSTAGSGALMMNQNGNSLTYSFAYDGQLFRRSDGTVDQCFSRDASDPGTGLSVWRYGLYDAGTGARIDRNSGFPIDYTSAGHTYHGFLGYWGMSLPPDALSVLMSGDIVQKVDYGAGTAPTKTDFTVVKSAGKLTRYTKRTRDLRSIDQIRFNAFVGDASNFFAGATSNSQYEVYWDQTSGSFHVTALMICGNNGCQSSALNPEQIVAVDFFAAQGGVAGWSQSLGGELYIDIAGAPLPFDASSVSVIYRTQDIVYPADLPATLYCIRDCPTSASMSAYFGSAAQTGSPFEPATFNNWNPAPAGSIVSYSGDTAAAGIADAGGQPVTFTSLAAISQHPQYQNGLRTGRLFTNLDDARCAPGATVYCDAKVNSLDVYYIWETGPNSYNQFAAVKDSSGAFVVFEAPLQVTYNVPGAAAFGQYAGKSIVLQYGGFGELYGIPGHCVSHLTNAPQACEMADSRYVPEFVIPYDAVSGVVAVGSSTYLVKWLEREIRFAAKDPSQCLAANLQLPGSVVLPTSASLKDPSDPSAAIFIGAKPVVTDAPRVIQGEVKY